jgi:nucleoside-diphosphate-sugar epimerase
MTSVPTLISGAAGPTGSVATKLLLQMGFPVRAIVRGDDERAQSLRALEPPELQSQILESGSRHPRPSRRHSTGVPSARLYNGPRG